MPTVCIMCLCVCCVSKSNSDCWPTQHKLISFYNRGWECFYCAVLNRSLNTIHFVLKAKVENWFNVVCTVLHIAVCRRTNKMHKFLRIIFIFPMFLLAVHVSDELHVRHQEHCLVNCITQLVHSCRRV